MKLKIVSLGTALLCFAGSPLPASAQSGLGASSLLLAAPPFSYAGDKGPGFWDGINRACAGAHQSPINIDTHAVDPDTTLQPLDVTLAETSFTLENPEPGYTIQATAPKQNLNMLVHNGAAFTLRQFHFHTFSEHTLDGSHSEMELHAVFEDENAHYAVIGVLYRLGAKNLLLQKLIDAGLPEKTTSPKTEVSGLTLVLKGLGSYYTYQGGFTTPPCSEVVTWFVLKHPAELSPQQFEAFRKILGNDFRPTQSLNDRIVRATAPR